MFTEIEKELRIHVFHVIVRLKPKENKHLQKYIKRQQLTISITEIWPLANAMALGGVATGSINANEQATVAGIMRSSGLIPMLSP